MQKDAEKLSKVQDSSLFGKDREARTPSGKKGPVAAQQQREARPEQVKSKDQIEREARKFRGKRNSTGAKMAKFRGGDVKKRSGGGIGDRDLSGKSKSM